MTTTRALTGTAEHPVLTIRRLYDASPDEIWDACTDIERLRRWFGAISGSPAAVGDPFTADLGGDDDTATGRVLACEDHTLRVAWSWQGEPESVVTARVAPIGDGTTALVIEHALAQPNHAVGYGGGWEQTLQALARSLGVAADDAPTDDAIEADAGQQWRTITRAPLEVTQVVAASVEETWAALATADGLRTWWWRHWDDVTIHAEVRIGREYRIEAPGAGITLEGTYLVVDEPSRLAFTWRWRDDDGTSSDEAVDIRLSTEGDGTRLVVRHTGPWSDDAPAAAYRQGWEFTLAELDAVLID